MNENINIATGITQFLLERVGSSALNDRKIDTSTGLSKGVLVSRAVKDINAPDSAGMIIKAPLIGPDAIPGPTGKFTLAKATSLKNTGTDSTSKPVLLLGFNPEAEVVARSKKIMSSLLFKLLGTHDPRFNAIDFERLDEEFKGTLAMLGACLGLNKENIRVFMTRDEFKAFKSREI